MKTTTSNFAITKNGLFLTLPGGDGAPVRTRVALAGVDLRTSLVCKPVAVLRLFMASTGVEHEFIVGLDQVAGLRAQFPAHLFTARVVAASSSTAMRRRAVAGLLVNCTLGSAIALMAGYMTVSMVTGGATLEVQVEQPADPVESQLIDA